jgi:hypothetical protein
MTAIQSGSKSASRRALLAGALGGLGAWAASAIGRAAPVEAAAGDPIRMGQLNRAGGTSTDTPTLPAPHSRSSRWATVPPYGQAENSPCGRKLVTRSSALR